MTNIEPRIIIYFRASDVFQGCRQVWNSLSESAPGFTWGDNSCSMVTVERLTTHVETLESPTDFDGERTEEENEAKFDVQLEMVLERLNSLEAISLVDLEA